MHFCKKNPKCAACASLIEREEKGFEETDIWLNGRIIQIKSVKSKHICQVPCHGQIRGVCESEAHINRSFESDNMVKIICGSNILSNSNN